MNYFFGSNTQEKQEPQEPQEAVVEPVLNSSNSSNSSNSNSNSNNTNSNSNNTNRQGAKRYEITVNSATHWFKAELDHVGRIASMLDPDLQYAYAMSTLNGMAHLKDALYELVTNPEYYAHKEDLQRMHDGVVRTMRHLKREYSLDIDAIRAFNSRGTLSNLSYLEDQTGGYYRQAKKVKTQKTKRQQRKAKKSRKSRKSRK